MPSPASRTPSSAAATPSGPRRIRRCRRCIDDELAAHGAKRVYPRGEGDARGDFDGEYRAWHAGLWPALATALDLPSATAEAKRPGRACRSARQPAGHEPDHAPTAPRHDGARQPGAAAARRRAAAERSTRHIEIALPSGMTYRAGDHLGVLPRNGVELIRRVMTRFGLDAGMYVTISRARTPHPPAGRRAGAAARRARELCRAAGRRDARGHRDAGRSTPTIRAGRQALRRRSHGDDARYRQVLGRAGRCSTCWRRTRPASCRSRCTSTCCRRCARATTRSRRRRWSTPSICSITVGVLESPARSGDGMFSGVCSDYLAGSRAKARCSRSSASRPSRSGRRRTRTHP